MLYVFQVGLLNKFLLFGLCFTCTHNSFHEERRSTFNSSFKHVVSHLDDLKIANRGISNVETMIREQEWKRLHT